MRNLLVAIALLLSPFAAHAADCPALDAIGQQMVDVEKSGEQEMTRLLGQLAAERKWGAAKTASYVVEINSQGKLPELQRLRQIHALKAASLALDPASKCADIEPAFRLTIETIREQWDTVNAEIRRELRGAQPTETVDAAASGLRFSGIYQSPAFHDLPDGRKAPAGTTYLRFYADGTVVEAGSTGTAEQVRRWLTPAHEHVAKGTYRRDGNLLSFSVTTAGYGSVDFHGTIGDDTLDLASHSNINGHDDRNTFEFVPD